MELKDFNEKLLPDIKDKNNDISSNSKQKFIDLCISC